MTSWVSPFAFSGVGRPMPGASPELVDEVCMAVRNIVVELAQLGVKTVDVELVAQNGVGNDVDAVRLCLTYASPPGRSWPTAAPLPHGTSIHASALPDGRTMIEWSSADRGRIPFRDTGPGVTVVVTFSHCRMP